MINSLDDTISAIATVIGVGGVSIIRLSGKNSENIINRIFYKNKKFEQVAFTPNTITHGYIYDNTILVDEVIVLCFRAPNSYTGEDVFEIQCHGGINVTNEIFELTLKNGARIAQRGEFTKRAFMNGKMDLSKAESVLDLISAKTKKIANISANNLCGKLSSEINKIRDDVIDILTHIVAAIDFPEEVEEPSYENIITEINSIIEETNKVLAGAKNSNLLRNGIKITIAGKPNVGKSSLFNSLLNYDRAIVTDIAGTTRDTISEIIDIKGIPANLTDTAGIRDLALVTDTQKIENIGIEYSKQAINEADIVIFTTDLSSEPTDEDKIIFELLQDKKYIIVGTKSDLPQKNSYYKTNAVVSNLNHSGMDNVISELYSCITDKISNEDTDYFTNARQQEALEKAKSSLNNAVLSLKNNMEQDFVAIDIKTALMSLGEITGDDITQEILNNIFDKFCIGK